MKNIGDHRLIAVISAIALAFVAGGFGWAFFMLRGVTGNPLILHFDDINGITQVGGLAAIGLAGLFGAFVVIIDFFIAIEFDDRDRILGKFLAVLALVFAVLLFIAFAAIISVNV
jgi:hypothetical protein